MFTIMFIGYQTIQFQHHPNKPKKPSDNPVIITFA